MTYEEIKKDFSHFRRKGYGGLIVDYPECIMKLVREDIDVVEKIIDFYYGETQIKVKLGWSYDDVIQGTRFITNEKGLSRHEEIARKKFIRFNKDIIVWLKSNDGLFFRDIFSIPVSIDSINEYKKNNPVQVKYEWRDNQLEAFNLLDKYGVQNGIHCQATGCGKSFIILRTLGCMLEEINSGCIILFTERVSILADLFDLKKGVVCVDKNNIQIWKELGLCDLLNVDIIDRCTIKKNDWVDIIKNSTKPTLLVINRAFLTSGEKYKEIDKGLIKMVLHDECHNTGSSQCFEFLKYTKNCGSKIVGFSATPLRAEKEKEKLLEIYGDGYGDSRGHLKLLTDYNMMYAISKGLILKPVFYLYCSGQLSSDKEERKMERISVSEKEIKSVMEILDKVCGKILPNKKIVAWCGTIKRAKLWKEIFELHCREWKSLKKMKAGVDTSESKDCDYNEFKDSRGNFILFCANKHREGSDIKYLDCCIFLDKVKNRGCLPFIQSIGRVLRIGGDKIIGVVIDCCMEGEMRYEIVIAQKILGYYCSLNNLANAGEEESKYDYYAKIHDIVKFDDDKETISIGIGNDTIDIVINRSELEFGFGDIQKAFDDIVRKKIKIGAFDNMKLKGDKYLKGMFGFDANTDFSKAYEEISCEDKEKYGLPDIKDEEYMLMFENYSWFDILGITHDFYESHHIAKESIRHKIKLKNAEKNWKKWCSLDSKLPPCPMYVWKGFKWEDMHESNLGVFF